MTMLLKVIILMALIILCFEVVLMVVFAAFAASGPARWLYLRAAGHAVREDGQSPLQPAAQREDMGVEQ